MLEKFDLPYRTTLVGLYAGTYRAELAHLPGAQTVPAMTTPSGAVLTDSLAMAETLYEENPHAGLYPADKTSRAMARSLVAEMHGSFGALRGACPHNMDHVVSGFKPTPTVQEDIDRIVALWEMARNTSGASGPWLFGEYSLADVFYAPIANRFTTYGIALPVAAQAYVDAHVQDISNRQWRAMGQTVIYEPFPYDSGLPRKPWPIDLIGAKPVDSGTPENEACPYSGKPITHLLECRGRIFGFCNAVCRDKTVADPGAWPKFMTALNG